MSLDVYLENPVETETVSVQSIFIRENGQTVSITPEEWTRRFPDREPVTCRQDVDYVFRANITHNLNKMAGEAGIYDCLWRPDENGITKASQLIEPLREGLALMKSDPERFEKLNPSNGWGTYAQFIPWIEKYLMACEQNPNANVQVSR